MNILIGDISSYKAIVSAKFIRSHYPEAKLFGFDSRGFAKNIHTRYVDETIICPEEDVDRYLEIIDERKIDFFIPVINKSLAVFWEQKERFGKSLGYLGRFEDYSLLNDKTQVHKLATSLDVRVPKRYDTIIEAELPFVVKPTNLSSAEGVEYFFSKEDLKDYEPPNDCIIQEYVEGEGVGFSFYAKNGKILNSYGHRRLAEYPVSGGSSTYRTGFRDARMLKMSERVVGYLGYTGFAMFEFKHSDNDDLLLLEVNPRIWGSINQGMINGVNYFEDFLGESPESENDEDRDLKTYLSPHTYATLFLYLFKGNLRPLRTFVKNIGKNRTDVSLFHDPFGYFSTLLRKIS